MYSSVTTETLPVLPPKLKPASWDPAPAKPYLAVVRFPPADHDVPLYSSVTLEALVVYPPKLKPAVWDPQPAI